jgi:hypothetical protein
MALYFPLSLGCTRDVPPVAGSALTDYRIRGHVVT